MADELFYDEFSLFQENADDYGVAWTGPPVVRRASVEVGDGARSLSALIWGTDPPDIVLLHGGAQNAHTWDTVALALNRPVVAIDLPGHGHSDHRDDGRSGPREDAVDVASAIRRLAPDAPMVVGMSLGGLTGIALAAHAPDLVRTLVLVDVTPGVNKERAAPITQFVSGPESFASFDEILARTIEYNPTRSEQSLRRGVMHNAMPRDDGRWVWRHQHPGKAALAPPSDGIAVDVGDPPFPDFTFLWDDVSKIEVPLMLIRGTTDGSVVTDEHADELMRRRPNAVVVSVQDAGHSIQGDKPVELAQILADFLVR